MVPKVHPTFKYYLQCKNIKFIFQVYDGLFEESSVLGRYCGTRSPGIILTSSRNRLIVYFVSDHMISGEGFNITYALGTLKDLPLYSIVSFWA